MTKTARRPTPDQQRLLETLNAKPRTARGLSDHLGADRVGGDGTRIPGIVTTPDAVSSSLRRMEEHGWVRRTGDRERRGVLWQLTSDGERAAGLPVS